MATSRDSLEKAKTTLGQAVVLEGNGSMEKAAAAYHAVSILTTIALAEALVEISEKMRGEVFPPKVTNDARYL